MIRTFYLTLLVVLSVNAQSYTTSWIGNTYGGGKTNRFVAQDAKDACVTADGKVICGTWWDEGHREVAVYWDGGVQDLNNRSKCLAVATDNSSMYFDNEGRIFKYRLLNYSAQDTVSAEPSFILGLACAKGRLYASRPHASPIY